jgi:hypothetical protein
VRGSTIADPFGLYWDFAPFLFDWTNRLLLRDRQGPDWSFSAILASFDALPGDLTDLLELYLHVENRGDTLEIIVQGGRWDASHPLGRASLYGSVRKALVWLPAWRSIATGSMIRVFGLAEEIDEPLTSDSWMLGDRQRVEIASRSASI